jgi:serine/threonine protein kinase
MTRSAAALLLALLASAGGIAIAGPEEHLGKVVTLASADGTSRSFVILGYLGSGYWDDTYDARDSGTGERVAVKLLRAQHGAVPDSYDAQTGILARSSHRTVPKALGVGTTQDGRRALVMEFADGEVLGPAHVEWARTSRGKAVRITLQILRGVRELERIGVRHNDVHPQNVMLRDRASRSVKLLDVGNATPIEQGSQGALPFYNAPTHGAANDDVYSAGTILIHLVTGKPSLEALPLIRNSGLRAVAAKATHPQVSARYQTAQEMIDALRPYRGGKRGKK